MTSYQPGEQPSYAPPQDPWSGTQGVAATPTDPIPQPPRGKFSPGVAAPVPPAADLWSQETVAHDDRYTPGRGPAGRGALFYTFVTLVVLLLGGAGGYGAWYLITDRIGTPTAGPTTNNGTSAGPSLTTTVPPFHPDAVRVGDCLLQVDVPYLATDGTQKKRTTLEIVACGTDNSYAVVKIDHGAQLPEDPVTGGLDDATADAVCKGTPPWDGAWAAWDSDNDSLDYFYCLDDPKV
ncbi:MAG TPA: hypothetical protein VH561_07070 [Micromonosporaceae bacterium]|jgi:hypothetical protein